MFTSRCTTQRVCADPTLTRSIRQAIIGGAICRFRTPNQHSSRTDDHMMSRTHTPSALLRHTGTSRSAASWRAPLGAAAGGACAATIGHRGSKRIVDSQRLDDRKQQMASTVEMSSLTSAFEYRPLDAAESGAGSGAWGDTR
jgi:hypothetical protein